MRVLLILVVFGTIGLIVAGMAARRFVRYRNNQRHIEKLERENARYTEVNDRLLEAPSPWDSMKLPRTPTTGTKTKSSRRRPGWPT